MNEPEITIYTRSEDLPLLSGDNIFHSASLFKLYEQTPRLKPYMVVATDDDGRVIGHLLAVVRYRTTLFPPFIYKHCSVLGEGCYTSSGDINDSQSPDSLRQSPVFARLLRVLMKKVSSWVGYVEFSNLSTKMFGYKEFREEGFFPVKWQSVRNSLHSRLPEERISDRMKRRIEKAYKRGITTEEVKTEEELCGFYRLLQKHNSLKLKRYIPDEHLFRGMMSEKDSCRLFITKYKERVIGCSASIYSGSNAYLWYFASRRKSYSFVYPDILTIWHAIKDAHRHGYEHFIFLDVGLPFRKSRFRDFILSFGGKPISTYRWFRFGNSWINGILRRIYI